jgi:hypothetical protein
MVFLPERGRNDSEAAARVTAEAPNQCSNFEVIEV